MPENPTIHGDVKITIPFVYTEEIIPKRCRLPRRVEMQGQSTLTIHSISSAEAPIAIRQRISGWDDEPETVQEYRWWRNRLWLPCSIQRVSRGLREGQTLEQFTGDPYPFSLTRADRRGFYCSLRERRADLRRWASGVLFIDGVRYTSADEPRYVVMTFGLGCNHGIGWGTSLSATDHYNSNIGKTRYFRCDQLEQAMVAATRIAIGRGDTNALPITDQKPSTFEILIPEAVRLNPSKEHGDGDPFINSIENLIEGVKDPLIAGLGAMGLLAQEMAAKTWDHHATSGQPRFQAFRRVNERYYVASRPMTRTEFKETPNA